MAKQYELPAELGVAIATDRAEFCSFYAARIASSDPEKAEMARLIGDLLSDRYWLRQRLCESMEKVRSSLGNIKASMDSLEAAEEAIRGASDLPGAPDEEAL